MVLASTVFAGPENMNCDTPWKCIEDLAPDALGDVFGDSYPYSIDYDWPMCKSDSLIKGTVIVGVGDNGIAHCWANGTDNATLAFDGDTLTFFDPYEASTKSWCGLLLSQPYELTEVRICNPVSREDRIIGSAIQGSNDYGETWHNVVYFDKEIYGSKALLANDYHIVTPNPNQEYISLYKDAMNLDEADADFSRFWVGQGSYNMYRYVNLIGTFCTCAEIELYGHPADANSVQNLGVDNSLDTNQDERYDVEYKSEFSFQDVSESAWYYNDVKKAVETGLVNGKTETTFCPDDYLTYAEAVKLASCMHQKYTTGSVSLTNGDPWYQSYVDYAWANALLPTGFNWNERATRAGYISIFAHALPDIAYEQINSVPDGSIPDVPMTHPQAKDIYRLYRAGILQGSDSQHNCNPYDPIKRSEVAAILTRMMNSDQRISFSIQQVLTPPASDPIILPDPQESYAPYSKSDVKQLSDYADNATTSASDMLTSCSDAKNTNNSSLKAMYLNSSFVYADCVRVHLNSMLIVLYDHETLYFENGVSLADYVVETIRMIDNSTSVQIDSSNADQNWLTIATNLRDIAGRIMTIDGYTIQLLSQYM